VGWENVKQKWVVAERKSAPTFKQFMDTVFEDHIDLAIEEQKKHFGVATRVIRLLAGSG
jgi:hypothetical protein